MLDMRVLGWLLLLLLAPLCWVIAHLHGPPPPVPPARPRGGSRSSTGAAGSSSARKGAAGESRTNGLAAGAEAGRVGVGAGAGGGGRGGGDSCADGDAGGGAAVAADPHRRWRRGWGALCAGLLALAPLLVVAEATLARPSLVACSGCVGWSPVPTGQRLLVAAAALYPATVKAAGFAFVVRCLREGRVRPAP